MILMDFLPDVVNPVARVLQTLKQFTEFANSVDIRKLERRGISVLFKHVGQRNHAASILQDKLQDILLPKETWIEKKDKLEVAIFRFPTHLDPARLKELPGILDIKVHYKQVRDRKLISQVILFWKDIETATKCINEGILL